jgi:rod shape-determining protein MreC
MIEVPTLRRPLALLAAVLVAQVLLLAAQIKREGEVRLISMWGVELMSLVQRPLHWMIDSVGGAWSRYVALQDAREENKHLRDELDRLKLRAAQLESRAAEAQRLQQLLGFRDAHPEFELLAARVVAAGASETAHTLFLNRGENDGVKRNMAVLTSDGVVGKILEVYPATSQLLLIVDKESGVGALLANSRTLGIIRGSGQPLVEMQKVITDQDVAVGEAVLTSGLDRIFPKDLPVGTVVSAAPGNPFKVIRVRPAARLDRLEEVWILLSYVPPAVPEQASPRVLGAPARKPVTP